MLKKLIIIVYILVSNNVFAGDKSYVYDTIPEGQILYSQFLNKWIDRHGVCNICTFQNGFDVNGYVGNKKEIFWREVHLFLLNDSDKLPSVASVAEEFDYYYAVKNTKYKTYVKQVGSVFHIFIPMEAGSEHINLFWRTGHLNAVFQYVPVFYKQQIGK